MSRIALRGDRIVEYTESKYGDWTLKVFNGGSFAMAQKRLNGGVLHLPLARANGSEYDCFEGWWPYRPVNSVQYGIGGLCLWCHRWTLFFEPINGRSQPARRYPASEIDRKEVVERIKKGGKGARVTHMDVPIMPRTYHVRTVDRQVRAAMELGIRVMYYHLPVAEYHSYITEIEEALGEKLPQLHELLEVFAGEVRKLILDKFTAAGVEVVFIDPSSYVNGDSNESFVLPYLRPDLFGIQPEGLVGIENLVEVRLAYEAHHQGGKLVPVYGIAVGIPYPYREKSSDMNGVVVLRLSP